MTTINHFAFSNEIKRLALEAGFDLSGVADVRTTGEHRFFPHWIDDGRAGDMSYLEARNEEGNLKRASLTNAAPWARSVVVCALNYNTDQPYSTHAGTPSQGWISRYAWTKRDYHDVLLAKLRLLESSVIALSEKTSGGTPRTWCYVDTGPVIERIVAKYAGIGWIGKNTCILNEKLGSWLFLGIILTSLELTPELPPADRCGSCTRCLDACPTNAFPAPYELDATRCISYLTIEKRGAIPEEFRPGIGRQVFGCDICQDVCPWNRKAPHTKVPDFEGPFAVGKSRTRMAGAAQPGRIPRRVSWIAGETRQTFRPAPQRGHRHWK